MTCYLWWRKWSCRKKTQIAMSTTFVTSMLQESLKIRKHFIVMGIHSKMLLHQEFLVKYNNEIRWKKNPKTNKNNEGSVFKPKSYTQLNLTFLHLKYKFSLIRICCQYFKWSELISFFFFKFLYFLFCIMVTLNKRITKTIWKKLHKFFCDIFALKVTIW